jgi:predicted CoA-binding protein
MVTDTDGVVELMLTTCDSISVVGVSTVRPKAAHTAPPDTPRHGWRTIPVNPHATRILDKPVYRSLADVPGHRAGGLGRCVPASRRPPT